MAVHGEIGRGQLRWRAGDLVLGSFVVVRALTWDSSGVRNRRAVFEAREAARPWRRVAVKVSLVPELAGDELGCVPGRSVAREVAYTASVLAGLEHPRIVRLVADASGERFPALVLSWADGRPLDRALDGVAPDERLEIAIQIAEIVAHAHARGVLLWDLKPANLLFARTAQGPGVTLVDLDLARSGCGRPGGRAGTWRWTAPEQAVADAAWIDRRADLYALGTTLHFLFTGRPLFSEGRRAVCEQFLEDRVLETMADLPQAIAPVIAALVALDRRDRPLDATEVLAQLQGARTGTCAGATRAGPPALERLAALLAPFAADQPEIASAAEQDLRDDLIAGLGDALAEDRPSPDAWRARVEATIGLHADRRYLERWSGTEPDERGRAVLRCVRRALELGRLRDAFVLAEHAPVESRDAAWHAIVAELHLHIHDPVGAIDHAELARADPRALAVLARAALQIGDRARAVDALDELTAALDDPASDTATAALELEVAAFRPERALALAARLGTRELAARLVRLLREWLHHVDHVLDADERAALALSRREAADRPRILGALGIAVAALLAIDPHAPEQALLGACAAQLEDLAAMRPLGRILTVLDRFAAGRDEDGLRALRASLRDRTLTRASIPVLHGLPLSDLFERDPDDRPSAAWLARALLLEHLGLGGRADGLVSDATRSLGPLDLARWWIVRRQPDRALELLDRLAREPLAEDAGDLARALRGLALRAAGAIEPAIAELSSAYRARRTWHTAYWLCDVLAGADRAAECLPIIDEVWRSEGADPMLAEHRIHGLLAVRSYRDAIGETRAAVELERSERPLAVLRAALQRHLHHAGAVATAPAGATALGEALVLAGLAAEHAPQLRAIYEADPSSGNLVRAIAAYRARGDLEPGLALAVQALRDRPSAEAAAFVADGLLEAGAAAEASALLADWLALAPNDPALWRLAARAAVAGRQGNSAVAAAGRALALSPADPVARLQLAIAQLERGDAAGAAGLAQLCIAERPDDELAWDVLVQATSGAGRHDAALVAARAAVATVPSSAVLQHGLAQALLRRGDPVAAEPAAAEAVALAPQDGAAWRTLVLARLDQGRAAEALACCHSLRRAGGPVAEVAELMLYAQLQLGDFERAIAHGLEAISEHRERPLVWESLALAWLGRRELADAAMAVAMMERTGRARDRARRLAFYVGLAEDAPLAALATLGDAAVRARPHDHALAVVCDVVLRQTTAPEPGVLLDLGARLALARMAPALAATLEPVDGDRSNGRARARALHAFACAVDDADQQAAIERLIAVGLVGEGGAARDVARLCDAAARWSRGGSDLWTRSIHPQAASRRHQD